MSSSQSHNPFQFLAGTSLVQFIINFFLIDGRPIHLDPPQRAAINAIEFGYDIESPFFAEHPPENIPRGIMMKWPRQYGKTTAVILAAAALLVLVPNITIGTTSLNEQAAKDIKRRVRDTLRSNPETETLILRESALEIHMIHNGSRMECNPQTEGIRGRSYNYLLVDEAAGYEEPILAGAIMYTATRAGRRWIMLSTPQGSSNYFGKRYHQALRTRPVICSSCLDTYQQNEFNKTFPLTEMPEGMPVCRNCGGEQYEYGIGIYTIVPVDPWNCSFRTTEEIKALLDAEGWSALARQEILGEFIDDVALVFRNEWLERCTDGRLTNNFLPQQGVYYVCGADFGKYHDASSFCVTHKEGDVLVFDRMLTLEAGLQKLDYEDIKRDLFSFIQNSKAAALVPDATGVGDPIVEDIQRELSTGNYGCRILSNKNNRKGFVFDMNSKIELITNLEKLFSSGNMRIPGRINPEMEKMWQELIAFSYEITEKSIKYGTQDAHDDRVIALALSAWGHSQGRWMSVESRLGGRLGQIDRPQSIQNRNQTIRFTSHWTTR